MSVDEANAKLLEIAKKADKAKTGWYIVSGITVFLGVMIFSHACYKTGEACAVSNLCRGIAEDD